MSAERCTSARATDHSLETLHAIFCFHHLGIDENSTTGEPAQSVARVEALLDLVDAFAESNLGRGEGSTCRGDQELITDFLDHERHTICECVRQLRRGPPCETMCEDDDRDFDFEGEESKEEQFRVLEGGWLPPYGCAVLTKLSEGLDRYHFYVLGLDQWRKYVHVHTHCETAPTPEGHALCTTEEHTAKCHAHHLDICGHMEVGFTDATGGPDVGDVVKVLEGKDGVIAGTLCMVDSICSWRNSVNCKLLSGSSNAGGREYCFEETKLRRMNFHGNVSACLVPTLICVQR